MANEELIRAWRDFLTLARSTPGSPEELLRELSERIDALQRASDFLDEVAAFERALDTRRRLSKAIFPHSPLERLGR